MSVTPTPALPLKQGEGAGITAVDQWRTVLAVADSRIRNAATNAAVLPRELAAWHRVRALALAELGDQS
jgi:hypothetical protein